MSNNENKFGLKGVIVVVVSLALFIFSWNIAYDIIGYPSGAKLGLCLILTLVIFAILVSILTLITKSFGNKK